ncbi:MAG: hypothetical protein ACK49N_12335 [Verrucomicrobiota bacterium]
MNIKNTAIIGALALLAGDASAATRTFVITGATAFRAAANNAIIQLLGGAGVTQYAFTGTQGIGGTNRAIFKGTMAAFPGDEIIVKASWSGSTQGIKDVADQTAVQVLKSSVAMSTTGVVNTGSTADFETAIPRWSFSDVDKFLSERPNAPLAGGPVGVVPFMFIAGEGAPAGVTNMTDQLHATLWSTGSMPASMFTGNSADTVTILATGRNNGSGTRATILAETGYGAFTNVVQYNATFTGNRTGTGNLTAISEFGNGGHSSNSGVRDLLTRDRSTLTFGGDPIDAVFVSYLTISDAVAATGYQQATGTVSGGEGAIPMTYNGVRYSEANVKNGAYSLWGYQQFYLAASPTAAETTFDTAFRATIPNNMGTAGIPIPQMTVTRTGGDGGPIAPVQ